MTDDIAINKAAIIRRCVARVREETAEGIETLENFTIQDSVVLNILRACEAAIDIAMHSIATEKFGVPQSSRHAFEVLAAKSLISETCATSLKNMVGFRNIAVHSYQDLQKPILNAIVTSHLSDFEDFLQELNL